MQRLLLLLVISLFSFGLYAQKPDSAFYSGEIFTTPVEVMPEFKGGISKFYERLQNIPYAFLDRMNKREAQTIALLVIEKDGVVSNVKIIHGLSKEQDIEVIRVIRHLQKWKPGLHGGKPVRVQYAVPINFEIARE